MTMQIPIINGIYTDNKPDVRVSYPVNMVPVAQPNGVSAGYLRPGDGLIQKGIGPGINRGGINWNDQLYRVMGTKLCRVDSNYDLIELGDVGPGGPVTFTYSFDRLAIASNGKLWYYDGSSLTQVTDVDLGLVVDVEWIDGYFMTTDGEFIVVTELSDPTQVNPLKYGSSEIDPDPIVALLKLRNEIYALNRYTIEVFDNVGGDLFPFQRIDGAQIPKGCVGTHACCIYLEALAFLGSSQNESPSIYLGTNGRAVKISTREIDAILLEYTEPELRDVVLEKRKEKSDELLYVHLPDKTLVYDDTASAQVGQPIWYVLTSSLSDFSTYRGRYFVYCYNQETVGDPTTGQYGITTNEISSHWGQTVRWEFGTTIIYNGGNGGIFHELELVALTGRVSNLTPLTSQLIQTEVTNNIINSELNQDLITEGQDQTPLTPMIRTSYSVDGVAWSQDRSIMAGRIGDRTKRLVWRRMGKMENWRIQRFQGDSMAHIGFLRLEAQIEGLNY